MLNFIKKIFGAKPTEVKEPAKVEAVEVSSTPKVKKPSVKKATTRKPKAPKTPKA